LSSDRKKTYLAVVVIMEAHVGGAAADNGRGGGDSDDWAIM